MNLAKLFEMQRVLDERIIKEKGLEGQDLLPNTILALQVELGELANEWRGFKHWSNDREPRSQKMLVEYVDCLHFALSINLRVHGIDHKYISMDWPFPKEGERKSCYVLDRFMDCFGATTSTYGDACESAVLILIYLLDLGYLLGFSEEQIEQAYIDKNKVNHERQTSGY